MAEAPFTVTNTALAGLRVLQRNAIGDDRGFLSRLYCADEMAAIWSDRPIAQINQTVTRIPGTIRGLHFQYPPHAEDKVVNVLAGEAWDVAVDLRRGSPTFLRWHAEHLSAANRRSMLIPAGFAHGLQTLAPDTMLVYFHTHRYEAGAEGAVNAFDPMLAIDWPLPVADLSPRDRDHPLLTADFPGIAV